ncbi:MAG: dihydrodipicolinate synthase family protein [Alicyclobacillus sp.]|nr:dihydrodipicolinate synthase family protein [Alicyclobacillus sp.]
MNGTTSQRYSLRGILPVVAMPFRDDGSIDERGLESLLDHLMGIGVSGLMMFGIASEFYKLTGDERARVQSLFLRRTTQVPVQRIISITDHATEVACISARRAESEGADAINLFLPSFLRPSKAALKDHIASVASAVRLPIIVQYAPRETGLDVDVEFFAELRRSFPSIVGVKVETQPPGHYISRLREIDPNIVTMVGYAGLNMLDALERGASGIQPGCSFAEVYQTIWNAHQTDRTSAHELYRQLLPYVALWMQSPEYIIAVEKEILRRRGIIQSSYCRTPTFHLDGLDTAYVGRFLHEFEACFTVR